MGFGGTRAGQGEDKRQHTGQGGRAGGSDTLHGGTHPRSHLSSLRRVHVLTSAEAAKTVPGGGLSLHVHGGLGGPTPDLASDLPYMETAFPN